MDVVVIGAGQAGLAAAYHLRRSGLSFVVLDADEGPGGAWRHRWPTLLMEAVHGIHELPGMAVPDIDPTRPAFEALPEYFAAYEAAFELAVVRPVVVRAVRSGVGGEGASGSGEQASAGVAGDARDTDGSASGLPAESLTVETDRGVWTARALINATGTWRHPFIPYYPGAGGFRGRQLHMADYRGPAEFAGRHVVVVGGGTSAIHALAEIAEVGTTTWVTRRPPVFREGGFDAEVGRAVVARVEERVRAGLPPESVVSVTGLPPTAAVRAAREHGVLTRLPIFDRVTPFGVAWADGTEIRADAIVWATGFRAVLRHLAPLDLREPGGGIRMEGTRTARDPRIHLVGYGPSASTIGANRAGRAAVHDLKALLSTESTAHIAA
ncbi:FAD-dependent oxidoreductase [Embleya hyalina]|uniref:Oxidoreductase n=1 Tax=Embleya hyalina TaxID=516124 RepID=A0A401YSL4_9ACTN|nr:FAD-dependent oxidoreductase [Embleya hyalina]GCD97593.1 oxidoreductase [Embleya hyalina]